jgi:hypothetical protein
VPPSGHLGCRSRDWYAELFKIETVHKVLKSGCQGEQARLRTAERLTNLLAVPGAVAWRVFWLTMTARATPEAPAELALTDEEVEILDRLAGDTEPPRRPTVPMNSWRSPSWAATWRGRRARRRAIGWSGAG